MPISDEQITRLIYRSCLRLDAEDFEAYLDLFAPEFEYRISNYSVEIRKDQRWMDVNQDEYKALLESIPLHSKPLGTFARHANVYDIERNGEDRAKVTTFLTVYYTTPDGGTKVFAVGKYFDEVDISGDQPLIADREVRLETREVGIGSIVPM